ncbi:hypothetical protein G6011_03054 [Alternaria panax]|uniref:Uncharacterized protein n=1 Tax=Alternaria panax TaxID=48097 RepID=A0AAD4IEG0_9PLEO|nr:hypothetical protein G6011_03054 [Alternaria panax]
MPVASNYCTRSQSHRSPRGLGGINNSQDLAFLDQPCYHEAEDHMSHITVGTSQSRRYESESVHLMSQLHNTFQGDQQTLLQLMQSYSLHIIVAASLYMFIFEVSIRLPFLIALIFAIPSIHIFLTPEKPVSDDCEYHDNSEAFYRRSSIISVVPGEPVARCKTAGTLHPVAVTFPGLAFFSPSTWFPRATDPIDFRHKRRRLHTTFRESTYQPRRTFREAFEDTLPRMLEGWTRFVLGTAFYQITSRITIFIIARAFEATKGERMDVDAYVTNVLRFYWDWAAGMSRLTSYSMMWAISKLIMLLVQLSIWMGRQIMMIIGAIHDTTLKYEDLNTVQF